MIKPGKCTFSIFASMAKAVAPMVDLRVERHCAFDTFVSRVDKRTKHSSGLAIHNAARQIPDLMEREPERRQVIKSKFYKKVEEAYKKRNEEDPRAKRNREARAAAAKNLEERLRNYQMMERKGPYEIYPNLSEVDIPPDPRRMALFRYLMAVGPTPNQLFPPAQ